jgi:hypothetical protein
LSNIKPKHKALKLLPIEIYKKLPKKDLNDKTISFLVNNYPDSLLLLLESSNVDSYYKFQILEALSFAKEDSIIIDYLVKYSDDCLPALREAALYSLYNFNSSKALHRIEEIEIIDYNDTIREIAKSYLDEIFV